jgi:hypothetical protein
MGLVLVLVVLILDVGGGGGGVLSKLRRTHITREQGV